MQNMDNINLIFFIFSFSLILDVVKVINVDYSGGSVSCEIFFGISSSHFPFFNLIPFYVALVSRISSTLGFTINSCVPMCTIAGIFAATSCVLIYFIFQPRLSSYSISSNEYSCTVGGSSFYNKSNLLSVSLTFIVLSLMVVFYPVHSSKSKSVGSFAVFAPSNLCHFTSRVGTTYLVSLFYIDTFLLLNFLHIQS